MEVDFELEADLNGREDNGVVYVTSGSPSPQCQGLCLAPCFGVSGDVTCHTCHGCVTDFRPILGNPMEVTHVTSLGHVCIYFPMLRELTSLS